MEQGFDHSEKGFIKKKNNNNEKGETNNAKKQQQGFNDSEKGEIKYKAYLYMRLYRYQKDVSTFIIEKIFN